VTGTAALGTFGIVLTLSFVSRAGPDLGQNSVLNPCLIEVSTADISLRVDSIERSESGTGIIEGHEVIRRDEEEPVSQSRIIGILPTAQF
jgi:hypothetical protein